MLPLLLGGAAVVLGKLIYDKLTDDDDCRSSIDQDRQREKERENKQIKYEKIVQGYKAKLKNRYEAECICEKSQNMQTFASISDAMMGFSDIYPPLKFKKSKKLDDIQKDIENLKKDMDALWKINMYAKSLIKEENETSVK